MDAKRLKWVKEALSDIRDKGLDRHLLDVESSHGPRVKISGREVIMLCSNNYLGLAGDERLAEASAEAAKTYGAGSASSRLICGNLVIHNELEEKLAEFKGYPRALLFNSGYHANIGIITSLVGKGDAVFSDRLNHASIIDACRLSGAKINIYEHLDVGKLEQDLQASNAKKKLIVTESVFSMDGDIARLKDIIRLAKQYGAMTLVDEAHATGTVGKHGRGVIELMGLDQEVDVVMSTLGKAIGSFGAFAAASSEVIELLINRARSFIYTTALPPAAVGASLKALEIIKEEPWRREALRKNAIKVRQGLREMGFEMNADNSHIIPLIVGDSSFAMEACTRLLDEGVHAQGIRPPTVPEGTARMRITVMATHSDEDLDIALNAIFKCVMDKKVSFLSG